MSFWTVRLMRGNVELERRVLHMPIPSPQPGQIAEVWFDPAEVFSPATLASAERVAIELHDGQVAHWPVGSGPFKLHLRGLPSQH